jgi:glycosyltransferase involved in cell wall biosynthesis
MKIMAGLSVIVSDLPEICKVVLDYDIGIVVPVNSLETISQAVRQMETWDFKSSRDRSRECVLLYNWENQEKILSNVYQGVLEHKNNGKAKFSSTDACA